VHCPERPEDVACVKERDLVVELQRACRYAPFKCYKDEGVRDFDHEKEEELDYGWEPLEVY